MTKSERVRVGLTLPPNVLEVLDGLAESPRFNGNRSHTASWAILVGAAILSDSKVADVLFAHPTDVLDHYNRTRGDA